MFNAWRRQVKVVKILNRRQHISQVSVLDWGKKEDFNMKTSIPLFWAPKVKTKTGTIFNLTTDFSLLSAVIQ